MANNRGFDEIHHKMNDRIRSLAFNHELSDADRHTLVALFTEAMTAADAATLEAIKIKLSNYQPPFAKAAQEEKFDVLVQTARNFIALLDEKNRAFPEAKEAKNVQALEIEPIAIDIPDAATVFDDIVNLKQAITAEQIEKAAAELYQVSGLLFSQLDLTDLKQIATAHGELTNYFENLSLMIQLSVYHQSEIKDRVLLLHRYLAIMQAAVTKGDYYSAFILYATLKNINLPKSFEALLSDPAAQAVWQAAQELFTDAKPMETILAFSKVDQAVIPNIIPFKTEIISAAESNAPAIQKRSELALAGLQAAQARFVSQFNASKLNAFQHGLLNITANPATVAEKKRLAAASEKSAVVNFTMPGLIPAIDKDNPLNANSALITHFAHAKRWKSVEDKAEKDVSIATNDVFARLNIIRHYCQVPITSNPANSGLDEARKRELSKLLTWIGETGNKLDPNVPKSQFDSRTFNANSLREVTARIEAMLNDKKNVIHQHFLFTPNNEDTTAVANLNILLNLSTVLIARQQAKEDLTLSKMHNDETPLLDSAEAISAALKSIAAAFKEGNTGALALQRLYARVTTRDIITEHPALLQEYQNLMAESVWLTAQTFIAMDYQLFAALDPYDLSSKDPHNTVSRIISHNEKVIAFMLEDVLSRTDLTERTMALSYWLRVANQALDDATLPDLNFALAIAMGIGRGEIYSLSATKQSLSPADKMILDKLQNLCDMSNNYSHLRHTAENTPIVIPELLTLKKDTAASSEIKSLHELATIYKLGNKIAALKKQKPFNANMVVLENAFRQLKPRTEEELNKIKLEEKPNRFSDIKATQPNSAFKTAPSAFGLPEKPAESSPRNNSIFTQKIQDRVSVIVDAPVGDLIKVFTAKIPSNLVSHADGVDYHEEYEQQKDSTTFVKLPEYALQVLSGEKEHSAPGYGKRTVVYDPTLLKLTAILYLMLKEPAYFSEETAEGRARLALTNLLFDQLSNSEKEEFIRLIKSPNPQPGAKHPLFQNLSPTFTQHVFNNYQSQLHFGQSIPNKLELSKYLILKNDISEYTKVSSKSGGARNAGPQGGVYKTTYSYLTPEGELEIKDQLILFKQDRVGDRVIHDNVIAEYVAAQLMQTFIGDSAASVFLATPSQATTLPDPTGDNVYVGSVYYDDFKDLYVDLYRSQGLTPPKERPKFPSSVMINGMIDKTTGQSNYLDFERVVAASAMVGDTDVHSSNFGVTPETGANGQQFKRLRKIDHGAALVDLEDDLHIHSQTRHLPITIRDGRIITQPANQLLGYPRSLRISPEMAAEFDRIANFSTVKISEKINESIINVAEYYGPRPLLAFAKRIGAKISPALLALNWEALSKEDAAANKDKLIKEIQAYLRHRMFKRQESARRLATDIKLSLAFGYRNGKFHEVNYNINEKAYNLKAVILENPLYFLRNQIHFRGAEQRFKLGFIKIKYFRETNLNKLVQTRLLSSIQDIATKAREEKDLALLENLFANKQLIAKLPKDQFNSLQAVYRQLIIETTRDLISRSNEIFLSDNWQQDLAQHAKKLKHHTIETILQETAIEQRTFLLARWIQIMDYAFQKKDFNTAVAIFKALHNPEVARLTATFTGLPNALKERLKSIDDAFKAPQFMRQFAGDAQYAKEVIPALELLDLSRPTDLERAQWHRNNVWPRQLIQTTHLISAIEKNEPNLHTVTYSIASRELEPAGKKTTPAKILKSLTHLYAPSQQADAELALNNKQSLDLLLAKEMAALKIIADELEKYAKLPRAARQQRAQSEPRADEDFNPRGLRKP